MSQELETQFRQINAILAEADSILLVSHENPDPDAVASLLALSITFKNQGKRVFPFLPTSPVSALGFLPGFQSISTTLPQDAAFDVALCLDYGDFFRLRLPSFFPVSAFITIDHHPFSTQKGNVMIVAPEYSSTCEIIYWWLRWTGIPINKDIATCLLCGIISDTGEFLHASTSSKTFLAVSNLLSCGASLPEVIRNLRAPHHDTSFLRVLGRVLSKIEIDQRTKLAYSWASLNELSSCESGNFYLQDIPSLIAAASPANMGIFLIEEGNGFIRASLRAEPWSVRDVGSVARAFGGGGHKCAAGFRYQGTIKEVLQKVLELI